MNLTSKLLIFALFTALLTACPAGDDQNAGPNSQNRNSSSANTNSAAPLAKDDIEEFETIIKLPFHPEEVVWHEEPLTKQAGNQRVPSPNEKKLTAVLKFKPEDTPQIVAQAEKHKPGAPAAMNAESWFPAELIALTQISGDETLKGTVFPANDFFQPPYIEGKITRIESSNYFILELFSR